MDSVSVSELASYSAESGAAMDSRRESNEIQSADSGSESGLGKIRSAKSRALQGRIALLDALRGVCVVIMIIYHALYDGTLTGLLETGLLYTVPMRMLQAAGSFGFVFLSGLCTTFSKNPFHHGLKLSVPALLVSLATALAGFPVYFGALHLLAVSALLYGGIYSRILSPREKVLSAERTARELLWPVLWYALFLLTGALTESLRVHVNFLFPLGFRNDAFCSYDYYPLLPWHFVYLTGIWAGRRIPLDNPKISGQLFISHSPFPLQRFSFSVSRSRFTVERRFPVLCFLGRHSLTVYLTHQPLLLFLWFLASL